MFKRKAQEILRNNPDWPIDTPYKTISIPSKHRQFWLEFLDHWLEAGLIGDGTVDEPQPDKFFGIFTSDIEDLAGEILLSQDFLGDQKYIFHICYHDAMWLVPALEIWLGAGPDFDQHGEITTYYLSLLYKPKEMEFLGALAYFYRKMA